MGQQEMSRKQLLHKKARAWAAMDHALNQQRATTPGPVKLKKNAFRDKTAVIIGSGVAGLTTAYELLAQECGMQVIVLESGGAPASPPAPVCRLVWRRGRWASLR